MPAEENRRVVQAFYDASNRGDMETSLDPIADDIVWTNIGTTPLSGRFTGKQEPQEKLLGHPAARRPLRRGDGIHGHRSAA